jgi:predicted MFS family arabinose efflux permease
VVLGALNGVRALQFLVASPAAGVMADRMDRRRLLLLTQPFLVLTALTMGLLILLDLVQVWHLFAFTVIAGVFWAFSQPVRQAIVPTIVPRRDLMNAIALNSTGFNLTKVVGPAIGGLLIAWVGVGGNFLVQAAAFSAVWATLFYMQLPPQSTERARSVSALGTLKEGVRYIRKDRVVLALIAAALIPQVFAMPYMALLPVFQQDVLGVGPEALGLLVGAPGAGALVSTVALASVAHRVRRKGLLVLGALLLLGLGLIFFASTRMLPLGLVALALVGGCQVFFNATTQTLLQISVPDELRGRVMSIYMLDVGLRPAGSLAAGLATAAFGAPATVTGMGILVILVALVLAWRVPRIRLLEA